MKQEIISASREDIPVLAETLALAFDDSPVLMWALRTDTHREKALKNYFTTLMEEFFIKKGEILATDDLRACALWCVPNEWEIKFGVLDTLRLIPRVFFWSKTFNRVRKRMKFTSLAAEHHKHDIPHYYLVTIGVHPELQGQGLGSYFLNSKLKEIDEQGLPVYLECTNPRNVPFYERKNFEVIKEFNINDEGLGCKCMWRDPQPV